jgi:hypothetical protein
MRAEATAADVTLAVIRAILDQFDESDWQELAIETGQLDLTVRESRLMKSLRFHDDDYRTEVIKVVPLFLGSTRNAPHGRRAGTLPNLAVVERVVGLEAWLQAKDQALHHRLYGGGGQVVLEELAEVTDWLSVPDIDRHAVRIRKGLAGDPAQAVGSAKELLESVFKAILGLHGHSRDTRTDLLPLLGRVNLQLGLHAGGIRDEDPGAEQRRRIVSALNQLVQSTVELRNAGFGTGHGGSRRGELDLATVGLVVTAAVATATFYAQVHRQQQRDQ